LAASPPPTPTEKKTTACRKFQIKASIFLWERAQFTETTCKQVASRGAFRMNNKKDLKNHSPGSSGTPSHSVHLEDYHQRQTESGRSFD
jgi:hypothetical protein